MAKSIPQKVIRSSGNVFADMGLPDAAELYINAKGMFAGRVQRHVSAEDIDRGIEQSKVQELESGERSGIAEGDVELQVRKRFNSNRRET